MAKNINDSKASGEIRMGLLGSYKHDEEFEWSSLLTDYGRKPTMLKAWKIYLHCHCYPHRNVPLEVSLKLERYMINTAIREVRDYHEKNPIPNQDWMIERSWVTSVDRMVANGQTLTDALELWRKFFTDNSGYPLSRNDDSVTDDTIKQAYYRAKKKMSE